VALAQCDGITAIQLDTVDLMLNLHGSCHQKNISNETRSTDALVSLAEMINKGHATPFNENEMPFALISRAAVPGNQTAQTNFRNFNKRSKSSSRMQLRNSTGDAR